MGNQRGLKLNVYQQHTMPGAPESEWIKTNKQVLLVGTGIEEVDQSEPGDMVVTVRTDLLREPYKHLYAAAPKKENMAGPFGNNDYVWLSPEQTEKLCVALNFEFEEYSKGYHLPLRIYYETWAQYNSNW